MRRSGSISPIKINPNIMSEMTSPRADYPTMMKKNNGSKKVFDLEGGSISDMMSQEAKSRMRGTNILKKVPTDEKALLFSSIKKGKNPYGGNYGLY